MWRTVEGNAAEKLQELDPKSAQCMVTSPPFFGLRDYKTSSCHWSKMEYCLTPLLPPIAIPEWNGELGREPTPEMYVGHLVMIMRQVWRVLRDNGTAWLEIGDSYAGSGQGWCKKSNDGRGWLDDYGVYKTPGYISSEGANGVKPKDLFMIPETLALALRSEGWYVRSRICWEKPDCISESTKDRPTRSYENVWLLTKQKKYYYDAVAIREPGAEHPGKAGTFSRQRGKELNLQIPGQKYCSHRPDRDDRVPIGRNKRNVWTIPTSSPTWSFCSSCQTLYRGKEQKLINVIADADKIIRCCPNCGAADGWIVHFAPYPPNLVKLCILAGSSTMACPKCGAPWERMIEKKTLERYELPLSDPRYRPARYKGKYDSIKMNGTGMRYCEVKTIGWRPTCDCEGNDGSGRSVVLDPFAGTGTTLIVAETLGRDSVGIEMNPNYCAVSEARLRGLDQGALAKDGSGNLLRQATLF